MTAETELEKMAFTPPSGNAKPVEPKVEKRSGTTYVVLGADESGYWRPIANVEASSADFAIRLAASEETGFQAYVAVPARSWNPRKVTVESRPIVRLS